MTRPNAKNCVVLGGLDGAQFVEGLTRLRSELEGLAAFVADMREENDVAPASILSVGYEVDRDAVLIEHLDQRLTAAVSGLIDLLAATRVARATLERAQGTAPV